jgi:hypothetical protein
MLSTKRSKLSRNIHIITDAAIQTFINIKNISSQMINTLTEKNVKK